RRAPGRTAARGRFSLVARPTDAAASARAARPVRKALSPTPPHPRGALSSSVGGPILSIAGRGMLGGGEALPLLFLCLEMFLWSRPFGRRTFGTTPEQAEATRILAANQGLYNGLLAAGLAWAILSDSRPLATFFAACVLVAGIYGGITAKRSILIVQALPGAI